MPVHNWRAGFDVVLMAVSVVGFLFAVRLFASTLPNFCRHKRLILRRQPDGRMHLECMDCPHHRPDLRDHREPWPGGPNAA